MEINSLIKENKKNIVFLCNFLVALFFVTVLTFKKGYSFVPMTLGVISIIILLVYRFKLQTKWQLDKEDKFFIFSLIAYFLTFVMSMIFNGDGIREVDNPSRILLLIPMIFFFGLFPLKKNILFYAIPVGALIVGVLAIYQVFIIKAPRAFIEIMSIQAGDIAMGLSLLSIICSFYWLIQYKNIIGILYILFSIFGLLASLISGAKGSWIAFPFCFLIILGFYYSHINRIIILLIFIIISLAIILAINKQEFNFKGRYYEAKTDIINYIERGVKDSSQGGRLDLWENAIFAIKEKPILGHGSLGYEKFKKKQVESKKMSEITSNYNSLHNQYLESFVKRGILGFSALIAIMIIPLISFLKRLRTDDIALKSISILGIIHISAHSIFFLTQSFLVHNSGSIFYFFVLILLYHLVKQKENHL